MENRHRKQRNRDDVPRPRTIPDRKPLTFEEQLATVISIPRWIRRPRTRADCIDGPRPCPWVGCRWHLYLDVNERGVIKLNFPHLDVHELQATCALDIAEQDGLNLEDVGRFLNITRERIRQVELIALGKVRRAARMCGLVGEKERKMAGRESDALSKWAIEQLGGAEAVRKRYAQEHVAEYLRRCATIGELIDAAKADGWYDGLRGISIADIATACPVARRKPRPRVVPHTSRRHEKDPDRRSKIAEYVAAHPEGVSKAQVAEALGIPKTSARYHLVDLVLSGEVRQEGQRAQTRYLPAVKE